MAESERKKKSAHHGYSHTHVEHHKDGSHTIHHQHSEGSHKDVKHAAMDLDGVHDSLEQHLGEPNEGEALAAPAPAGGAPPALTAAAPIPGA